MSRLVYRKGVDLLVRVIPLICAANPDVDFVIGGDGPKRVDVEEMREQAGYTCIVASMLLCRYAQTRQ